MTIIIFILILALLILIHEFGHFIAAKKNEVKVEEFGFGLPPRLFGIKKGETLYSINLIPLGGFVKLYGEEYDELSHHSKISKTPNRFNSRAFIYKKPWQKAIIIMSGVIMNLILAITIFYGLLIFNNFKSDPIPVFTNNIKFKFGNEEKKVIIARINKNSPAEKANIKPEDIVIRYKIDNQDWQKIKSSSEFISLIKKSKNNPIFFDLVNNKNGERKIINVSPIFDKNLNRYIIGVNLADVIILSYEKPIDRLMSGFFHSYNLLDYNIKVIGNLFSQALKEKKPESITYALSGPVGIFAVIDDTVKSSGKKIINNLLNLTGLLSLSLALMNVLPFPALDGGRMIFVLYEWITKKKPNKEIEKYVNLIGFAILIILAIIISINDVVKFFR